MLNRRYGFTKIVAGVMTAAVVLTSVPAVSLVIPAANFGVMEVQAADFDNTSASAEIKIGEKASRTTASGLEKDVDYVITSDNAGIGVAKIKISASTLTTKAVGAAVNTTTPNTIAFEATSINPQGTFTLADVNGSITYEIEGLKLGTQTYTVKTAAGKVVQELTVTVKGNDKLIPIVNKTTSDKAKDAVAGDEIKPVSPAEGASAKYGVSSGQKILVSAPALSEIIEYDGTTASAGTGDKAVKSFSITSDNSAVASVVDFDAEKGKAILAADDLGEAKLTVKAFNEKGEVLSTGEITVKVEKSTAGNISSITYAEDKAETKTELAGQTLNMDTVVNTKRTINVKADGVVSFESSNPSAVAVSDSGVLTAKSKGSAIITVTGAETKKFDKETKTFNVVVDNEAADELTVKNSAGEKIEAVDLDVESSTAANAVKSMNLSVESANGNNEFTWKLAKNADGTGEVANSGNGWVKFSSNGASATIASADQAKTSGLYVVISTADKATSAGTIKGRTVAIPVKVYANAQDVITQDDVALDLETNKVTVVSPTSQYIANPSYTYTLEDKTIATMTTAKNKDGKLEATLTALKAGETTLKITQAEAKNDTETRRATTKTIKVTVAETAATINAQDMTITYGDSASIGAKASDGSAVSYKVAAGYEEYLDVEADGSIITKKVGTAPVIITAGKATKTINVKIKACELKAENISVTPAKATYTGKAIKHNVDVVAAGDLLIKGEDYNVTGATSVTKAGTYKITVKGIGNYAGTATKTFTVAKAATVFAKTATYTQKSTLTKSYKLIAKGDKNTKIKMTITGGNKASHKKFSVTKAGVLKVTKGAKKGTYKVKLQVTAGTNFKAATKTVKVVIK